MHLGRLEAARAEFQTAVAIYPDFPEAISNYGLVEFRLGHDQKAKMLFERALSLNAKGTVDYNYIELNLAGLLMKLGENDQALKILDPLIEEWPRFSPARSDRAIIRYQRGDVAGARSDAETALRLDPSNTQAQAVLKALGGSNPGT
jgi:tetratricopeptide (TPR) repeat protein